ncbi:nucleoside triphosphate pyrophosphohydrolase [Thermosulfuriphilus sp.]
MGSSGSIGGKFESLVDIVRRLRAPDGCPWDRQQTPSSLKKYLLEEAYEAVEAIDEDNPFHIAEELGDLLFLIIFVAFLYEEEGRFSLSGLLEQTASKMIRRHPHVFGDQRLQNPQEVIENWQRIKEVEARRDENKQASVLGNLPRSLPALQKAYRLGERASRVGFDWSRAEDLWSKVEEELGELKEAFSQGDKGLISAEMGDLLFTLVNLSRHLGINPEEALRETVERFRRRFILMEKIFRSRGEDLRQVSLKEMDAVWERIKAEEV